MQNLTCELRVIYKKTDAAKMKLLHVRVELPYGVKPSSRRIIKWHCEQRLVKMLRQLIDECRLPPAVSRETVDCAFNMTMVGSTSSQPSLYRPEFKVLRAHVYKKTPDNVERKFYMLTKTRLAVR